MPKLLGALPSGGRSWLGTSPNLRGRMLHHIDDIFLVGLELGNLLCWTPEFSSLMTSDGKKSACNAGDLGSVPGLGKKTLKGEATHSNILAWRFPWMEVTGHVVTKSWTQLSHQWHQFSSVQSLSRVWLCNPMNHSTPGLPVHHNSQNSPRLTSIESVMLSSHLILCRPFLLLPPIRPSIRVCSNESTLCMKWPKYWSFSLSIIPSKEIPGMISFRKDWLEKI